MQIAALLRDPSRQDSKKGGPPWIASVDGEAADWSSEYAQRKHAAPEDAARAALAWSEIAALPEWRAFQQGRPAPNRQERHGERGGFDLHPDRDEHGKRWRAYMAAGGARAWLAACTPAEEHAFGAAFVSAYGAPRAIEESA